MRRTGTLWIGAATFAVGATGAALADSGTFHGEAQKFGNGVAQIYAELDSEGAPRVLGVSLDRSMLEGLPEMPNTYSRCFDKNANGRIDDHHECNGDYELAFALPDELAKNGTTPFKWISVNWNPWAVRQIRPGPCSELIHCDDFKRAQIPVPKEYVHADHIDVGAAVPDMGNHLIDSKSPELVTEGRIFTHTFIFGAYDGQITFYEPMITRAYLESRPDLCVPIKQPQAWEVEGYYPTTYCIRYLAADDRYTVSLEDFVHRPAS